jgi:hypothetical protein
MNSIKLNNDNAAFQLHSNEGRLSLQLFKVQQEGKTGKGLQLQVLDEKDLTMFTHDLDPENAVTEIAKKFVFYNHITVRVVSKDASQEFDVEVFYE